MDALAEGGDYRGKDERIMALLEQFVNGSDLLLAPTIAQAKMPLTRD